MMISEVAYLRQQIESECLAMKLALTGLAAGVAKHSFIEHKMEILGRYVNELEHHIGKEQANDTLARTYMNVMED